MRLVYSRRHSPAITTVAESVYGFIQVDQHNARLAAAPETVSGDCKKSGESSGVISMMSQMAKDVENDIQEANHDEADAQKEYVEKAWTSVTFT